MYQEKNERTQINKNFYFIRNEVGNVTTITTEI